MARYFLRFRHSDTGLTPVFTGGTFFKKASDLSAVTPPAIGEVGNGTYYFDYSPTFDIVFEVDGGASIPTEEVRYISDTLSPKDVFVDEPTSQVKDDVLNATLTPRTIVDSVAVALKDTFKILKNRTKIDTTLDTLTVYDDDGTSVLYVFNLKDAAGAPSGETPFERAP